jgi:hypothetical protein
MMVVMSYSDLFQRGPYARGEKRDQFGDILKSIDIEDDLLYRRLAIGGDDTRCGTMLVLHDRCDIVPSVA